MKYVFDALSKYSKLNYYNMFVSSFLTSLFCCRLINFGFSGESSFQYQKHFVAVLSPFSPKQFVESMYVCRYLRVFCADSMDNSPQVKAVKPFLDQQGFLKVLDVLCRERLTVH